MRPAEPSPRGVELASFTHARANRQTQLGGVRVAYEFRRARRRHIGFTVGPEGLVVSAPTWVPLYQIEAALQKKADWIVRKLGEVRERDLRRQAARIDWKAGAAFDFLGEQVVVALDPCSGFENGAAALETGAGTPSDRSRLRLRLGLGPRATPAQIRDAVQAWLLRQATRVFTERLDHFAPRLGVRWRTLALSHASTRWGTAHASGAIRLNWRLIHFKLPVIDYVVAHELSHLRVMDHSPRFWAVVATVVPDYADLRAQLRASTLAPW